MPSAPPSWGAPPPQPWTPGPGGATFLGGPGPGPAKRRGLSSTTVLGSLVVVLVLLGASLLVVGGGTTQSPHEQLTAAITNALGAKTADVTLTGTVSVAGHTVSVNATGAMDFSANAAQLTLQGGAAGQSVSEQMIYVGGTEYAAAPGVGTVMPGKKWISMDLSALQGTAGATTGMAAIGNNPTTMLKVLQQEGGTVSPLGSSTVGGVAVQGYSVTFTPAAMQAQLAKPDLPSWMRQVLSQVKLSGVSYKVYVDGSDQLRRASIAMKESVGTVTVSVDESVDFTNYGTPVTITAPPADQVATFQQFLQAARAKFATAGTTAGGTTAS